jgi:hypothetical protein
MMRVPLTAFGLACLAAACAVWSVALLYEGLEGGGKLLIDWMVARWSGEQIDALMHYAGPLSLFLCAFSLILAFRASLHSKKRYPLPPLFL